MKGLIVDLFAGGGGGHRNAAGAVVPLARWFSEMARVLDLGSFA